MAAWLKPVLPLEAIVPKYRQSIYCKICGRRFVGALFAKPLLGSVPGSLESVSAAVAPAKSFGTTGQATAGAQVPMLWREVYLGQEVGAQWISKI